MKHSGGFTLIETMVAINLSLLVVIAIISVYLFSQKFINTYVHRVENKEKIINAFNSMDILFERNDMWVIKNDEDSFIFVFDKGKRIIVNKNNLLIEDYLEINDIDNINLLVKLKDQTEMVFSSSSRFVADAKEIKSDKVEKMELEIKIDKHDYEYNLIPPAISVNQFNNIERD